MSERQEIQNEENTEVILPEEEPEHDNFIITPSVVEELWENSRPKNMLIEIYQKQFKPKKILEDEPMDYNKLNILAEFQTYNLVFAKNELLMDNLKASYVLQLFWNLLPVKENGQRDENASNSASTYKTNFDNELLQRYREGLFSKEEILRLSAHSKNYFKHFILYDYVFNNPLLFGTKKNINIPHDFPKISPNLDQAMTLVSDNDEVKTENEGEEKY